MKLVNIVVPLTIRVLTPIGVLSASVILAIIGTDGNVQKARDIFSSTALSVPTYKLTQLGSEF